MRSDRPLAQMGVGLLLSLGVGNLPLGSWGERLISRAPLVGHELLWWVAVVVLLLYVLLVERRPLASIGFRKLRVWDLPVAIPAGILMVAIVVFMYSIVFPALHLRMNTAEMSKLAATAFWYGLCSSRVQRWRRKHSFAAIRLSDYWRLREVVSQPAQSHGLPSQ